MAFRFPEITETVDKDRFHDFVLNKIYVYFKFPDAT